MNNARPSSPFVNTPQSGLDDIAEAERPWTTTVNGTPEKPCSAREPRLVVEYVTVDGEDAQALARRQGAAIREVLGWFHANHRASLETGQAEASRS